MRISNDRNLFSVANLGVQYQQPFHVMQKALELIDAEPSLALNNVPYYTLDDERVELLREYFETRRENDRINSGAKWTSKIDIPKAVPADSSADGGRAGVSAE